ncbi:MAG: carboxypeptidase-like regulatory domain-containing protein [Myxococcota bacterium]
MTDQSVARTAPIGDNGRFRLGGLVPGDLVVVFDVDGYPIQFAGGAFSALEVVPVQIAAGEVLELGGLALRPGRPCRARCTRARPRPPRARCTPTPARPSRWSTSQRTAPGAPTACRPARPPPGPSSRASPRPTWKTPIGPTSSSARATAPEVTGLDLYLPPESVVTGVLEGAGGERLAGAIVSLLNDDSTVQRGGAGRPGGAFRFGGLHAGRYRLSVTGRARAAAATWGWVDVPEASPLDLGAVAVPGGAGGDGPGDGGRPRGGRAVRAIVVATGDGSARRFVVADAAGAYTIDGLAPGGYQLMVHAERPCASDPGYVATYAPGCRTTPSPCRSPSLRATPWEWSPVMPPDDDHDGMGDVWEARHGLDPARDDADLDPDEDGYTNLDEYLLGTDPQRDERRGCG